MTPPVVVLIWCEWELRRSIAIARQYICLPSQRMVASLIVAGDVDFRTLNAYVDFPSYNDNSFACIFISIRSW